MNYCVFILLYLLGTSSGLRVPKYSSYRKPSLSKSYPENYVNNKVTVPQTKNSTQLTTVPVGEATDENEDVYSILTNMEGLEPGSRVVLNKQMFEKIANDVIESAATDFDDI
jgi:hypothetical protein